MARKTEAPSITYLQICEAIKANDLRDNIWRNKALTLLGMVCNEDVPVDRLRRTIREFLDDTESY